MKNKWLRISFCFLTVFTLIFSMCPIAFGAEVSEEYQFSIDSDKPTVNDTSAYVELLFERESDGFKYVVVYSWSWAFDVNSGANEWNQTNSDLLLTNITFSEAGASFVFQPNDGVVGYLALTQNESLGYYRITTHTLNADNGYMSFEYFPDGYKLVGYHYYGNIQATNSGIGFYPVDFVVNYSTDAVITHKLNGLLATLQALSSSIDSNNQTLVTKLNSIISSLTSLDSSLDSFHDDFLLQMTRLFAFLDDYLDYFEQLIENTDEVEAFLDAIIMYLGQIQMYCEEIWYTTSYIYDELIGVNSKLQQIIDILNAGKDEPTIATPNDSLDSAFGDVSNWFGQVDGFGNQLEANKQENQQNLAQAGNVINGFFSVCPPQIIVALVFCAIMIVVAKAIGR